MDTKPPHDQAYLLQRFCSAVGEVFWGQHLETQKDPEASVLAKCFFEAWGTKANKSHIFQQIMVVWPCRLQRQCQATTLSWEMCGFWASVPQASKKHYENPMKTLLKPYSTLLKPY